MKRPTARREAKQADEALATARGRLDEARAIVAPVQQRIDADCAAIDSGESSISTFRSVHHWSGNEARRDHFVQLDGALSTWRGWATGGVVEDAELSSAVRTMKGNRDTELQKPLAHLASAVTEWVERVHPALLPHLEVESPTVRRGMGIDL